MERLKVVEPEIVVLSFEGFISHVSDLTGNLLVVYMAHVGMESNDRTAPILTNSNSMYMRYKRADKFVRRDNCLTLKTGKYMEKVTPMDMNYVPGCDQMKVRLLNKGIEVIAKKFMLGPADSDGHIATDCMASVVLDANEKTHEILVNLTGKKCCCVNGRLAEVPALGVCVKGKLLFKCDHIDELIVREVIVHGTKYSNSSIGLIDCSLSMREETLAGIGRERTSGDKKTNVVGSSHTKKESAEKIVGRMDLASAVAKIPAPQKNPTGSSIDRYLYQPTKRTMHRVRQSVPPVKQDPPPEHFDNTPRFQTPFKQSAFNEFDPFCYPKMVHVRFDKRDGPPFDTFWAFQPNLFMAIEGVLHDRRQRYLMYPQIDLNLGAHALGRPCLTRSSMDAGNYALCRGEIVKYAENTETFLIYMVDFGTQRWIHGREVIDITTMNKKDQVMFLPVALMHCRTESQLICARPSKELQQGGQYDMAIMSRDHNDIFTVRVLNKRPTDAKKNANAAKFTGRIDQERQFIHEAYQLLMHNNITSMAQISLLLSDRLTSLDQNDSGKQPPSPSNHDASAPNFFPGPVPTDAENAKVQLAIDNVSVTQPDGSNAEEDSDSSTDTDLNAGQEHQPHLQQDGEGHKKVESDKSLEKKHDTEPHTVDGQLTDPKFSYKPVNVNFRANDINEHGFSHQRFKRDDEAAGDSGGRNRYMSGNRGSHRIPFTRPFHRVDTHEDGFMQNRGRDRNYPTTGRGSPFPGNRRRGGGFSNPFISSSRGRDSNCAFNRGRGRRNFRVGSRGNSYFRHRGYDGPPDRGKFSFDGGYKKFAPRKSVSPPQRCSNDGYHVSDRNDKDSELDRKFIDMIWERPKENFVTYSDDEETKSNKPDKDRCDDWRNDKRDGKWDKRDDDGDCGTQPRGGHQSAKNVE